MASAPSPDLKPEQVVFAIGIPWKTFSYDLTDTELINLDKLEKVSNLLGCNFSAPPSVAGWETCLQDQMEWLSRYFRTLPATDRPRVPTGRIWLIRQALIELGEFREQQWLQNQKFLNVCLEVAQVYDRLHKWNDLNTVAQVWPELRDKLRRNM